MECRSVAIRKHIGTRAALDSHALVCTCLDLILSHLLPQRLNPCSNQSSGPLGQILNHPADTRLHCHKP